MKSNLRSERSQSKRFQHTGNKVSLCNRAQPLAGSHCCALLFCILLLGNRIVSHWSVPHWPHPQATSYHWATCRYLSCSALGQPCNGIYLLITDKEEWMWKWFSQDSGLQWWTEFDFEHIPSNLIIIIIIRNVFLVHGASWVSWLNMRVEVSQQTYWRRHVEVFLFWCVLWGRLCVKLWATDWAFTKSGGR